MLARWASVKANPGTLGTQPRQTPIKRCNLGRGKARLPSPVAYEGAEEIEAATTLMVLDAAGRLGFEPVGVRPRIANESSTPIGPRSCGLVGEFRMNCIENRGFMGKGFQVEQSTGG